MNQDSDVLKLVRSILADQSALAALRAGIASADVELIPQSETLRIAGISKSECWRRINKGTFPKPARLGERCNRWSKAEVVSWAAERLAARG